MKSATIAALMVLLGSAASAQTAKTDRGVVPAQSRPAMRGSATNFTGEASVRPVVDADQMGRTSLGEVTFAPGARSNWHTHPGGQAIFILEGCGWTQREGGPITKICKGDTAYVPADVKHWHGATATTGMAQLAVTEMVGGKNVTWLEPVSDGQFQAGTQAAP